MQTEYANFPKDFILILTGVSCTGKTTTAYNLIKEIPELKGLAK